MDVNDEEFWAALRRSIARAEAQEREELAEAERLLAAHGDADAPLGDEQIEAIVQAAIARDAAEPAAPLGAPAAEQHGAPAPVHRLAGQRFAGLRRFLTAAAALCVAPKFLAAATVVAVVAATAVVVRYSTQSLPFQEAVHILVDAQQPDANRIAADATVALDVIESIGILDAVTSEPLPIAEQARATLRRLRAQLDAAPPFAPRRLPDPLVALQRAVADRGGALAARQDALQRLGELLSYGVSALVEIARDPGPDDLAAKNGAWLQKLRQLLD